MNGFTKEEVMCHTLESKEELKTDAEQNISKFIDVAKQLEIFFLQRRLQLSVLKPEQLIKEVLKYYIYFYIILSFYWSTNNRIAMN